MQLSIGFSPCPNDTFIFNALINGKTESGAINFTAVIEDVEELNRKAFRGTLDVTKLSFAAFARVSGEYQLLHSGAALGKNCGPLLVVKEPFKWEELKEKKIAIPGKNTTANLLLTLFAPECINKIEMNFAEIEEAVLSGNADAGLIIHESRFTYEAKGLKKLADMGELWEQYTGQPIPLGCIAIRRSLPENMKQEINSMIRESVKHAFLHPQDAQPFIQQHASEMDPAVQKKHIELYVNDYSIDLGENGERAVKLLLKKGAELHILPDSVQPLFVTREQNIYI